LYAGTDDGLYFFDTNSSNFPGDFNDWTLMTDEFGLPEVYEVTDLTTFNNTVFAVIDNELMSFDNEVGFQTVLVPDGFTLQFITSEGDHLVVGQRNTRNQSFTTLIDSDLNQSDINDGCINLTLQGIEDERGRLWYADEWDYIRYYESSEGGCQQFTADSPFSEEVSQIAIKRGNPYVASGGVQDNFTFTFSRKGVYVFQDSDWKNINQNDFPIFFDEDILNFFRIAPHPDLDLIYLGTYWSGIVEFNEDTEEITAIYDQNNSSLQGAIGDEQRERISGLAFDRDNNLWIANYAAPNPVSVLTPEGNWHNFSVGPNLNLSNVTIDQNGYKWFPVFGISGGILVFDHGDRIEDPTDDRFRFINSNNSELTTNVVNDVAIDLEGSVWVATGEGPVIFDCGNDPFESDCTGRRIKVLQDSIAAFLLADVDINTIEIDGANRKWFGTSNGIFVQSASGDEQELGFSSSNSPLFDDNVIDLAFDGTSGEMWIGTDRGLQVYRTETTIGTRTHRASNVYSYPNPVPPEYNGPIAIKGLANDVDVKITDVNGKLVYETESLGGQAIWNGEDFLGQKVSSGVYLVFSSTSDIFSDPDSFVTKIMVVR